MVKSGPLRRSVWRGKRSVIGHLPGGGAGEVTGEPVSLEPDVEPKQDLPLLAFSSDQGWRAWLDEHHAVSEGLWLKLAKKDTGLASVSYSEALDVALCYGRTTPAGQAQVDQAKSDGRWDAAYSGQRTAAVPDDLQDALHRNPAALSFFATLNSANRYAILYRVEEAKRPETRARRIDKFVTMLAAHQTLHA
ncbi:MAG: YdeI/OmpD-associated family protein [Candidatus Dormibacteria bacterium]